MYGGDMKRIILSLWLGLSLAWATPAGDAAEKTDILPGANGLVQMEPGLFRVTASERKKFTAAFALPGGPDGFRRGGEGPAVYSEFAEMPLEFCWHKTPLGAGPENLALGYGEIAIKYAGEELILQRYRGEFHNGFREGRGELLAREVQAGDAFIYLGDFRQGRLEGRGVYVSADFRQSGEAPFIYEGEFQNDTFHGQGVMTDLETGRVTHSGLWFEGFPFGGDLAKWNRANRRSGPDSRLAAGPVRAGSAGSHE